MPSTGAFVCSVIWDLIAAWAVGGSGWCILGGAVAA